MLRNIFKCLKKRNGSVHTKNKRMHYNFKIKLNEKQIYETNSVKYFSEIIDNKLN